MKHLAKFSKIIKICLNLGTRVSSIQSLEEYHFVFVIRLQINRDFLHHTHSLPHLLNTDRDKFLAEKWKQEAKSNMIGKLSERSYSDKRLIVWVEHRRNRSKSSRRDDAAMTWRRRHLRRFWISGRLYSGRVITQMGRSTEFGRETIVETGEIEMF